VDANQLADAARRGGAGVGRRLHRSDIAAYDGRHESGIDLLPADEHHIGGLDHGVSGFDHADEPPRFDHAERLPNIVGVVVL